MKKVILIATALMICVSCAKHSGKCKFRTQKVEENLELYIIAQTEHSVNPSEHTLSDLKFAKKQYVQSVNSKKIDCKTDK